MSDKKSRLLAELVARNVLGVADVHNEIEVVVGRRDPNILMPVELAKDRLDPRVDYQGSEKSTS
jgi:hypothetical protein